MRGTTTLNRAAEPRAIDQVAMGPDTAVQHAERQLLDGLDRIVRTPGARGWVLLAMHLSRIGPSGPLAHHRRVIAAVLDDAGGKAEGRLFVLGNGDMALLFRPADGGSGITELIGRLFQSNPAGLDALCTCWPLPGAALQALDYIRDRTRDGPRPPASPDPQDDRGDMLALTAPLEQLVHRQTAILLRPGRADRLTTLFREIQITVPPAAAPGADGSGPGCTDPYLDSDMAVRLDRRMLAALLQDIPASGPLSAGGGTASLHLNLTVAGILSDGFAAFAQACRQPIAAGLSVAVEVPFLEHFADPRTFALAQERLRLAGLSPVLDGLSHHALLVAAPGVLPAHLVKLSWAASMPAAGAALHDAVTRLGPDRIVLDHADTEAALAWGLGRGIRRFQGRYVDTMLAAERLRLCPAASACTLRQCTGRAAAIDAAGRAGCRQPALLDLGLPGPLGAAAC